MRTPYDGAKRLRQREIDDLRLSITSHADRLATLRSEGDRIDAAAKREVIAAAEVPMLSSHAYLSRLRTRRLEVEREGHEADARLDAVRGQALTVFAAMRALEAAAESFRVNVDHAATAAEQAAGDDRFGAVVAQARAAAARRTRAA